VKKNSSVNTAETVVRRRALSLNVMFNVICYAVCDVIIVCTMSRMLRAVAAVVIILLNVCLWSSARLCCVWMLPNLS